MDQDVLESDNQIHQLIDDLGPFLLSVRIRTGTSSTGERWFDDDAEYE